jgi:hypothetical protein
MPRLVFTLRSDNVFEIGANTVLQKTVDGTALTAGTITAEIWSDEASPAKVGDTITITHQGSPNGYWSGPVADDHAAMLEAMRGKHVLVKLSIDCGAGYVKYAELDGIVEVDKGGTVP